MEESTPVSPDNKPDWSIAELYEKSWEIIKNNRILWIFGIAFTGAGIGFSSFGNSASNFNDIINPSPSPASTSTHEITQVLGAATTFVPTLLNIFSIIPWYIYLFLTLDLIFLICLGIITSLVYQTWSHASLIHGINSALGNQKPTIASSSDKAFSHIKPLIKLQIIPMLIVLLISFCLFSALALPIILGNTALKIIFGILTFFVFLVWIGCLLLLSMSQIWAVRGIVLENLPVFISLKKGFKIVKKKFWSMVLLGFINVILSVIIIGVPLAIGFGILLSGIFSFVLNQTLGIIILILGGIILIVLVVGSLIVSGILASFKASIWTIAYKKISQKYE